MSAILNPVPSPVQPAPVSPTGVPHRRHRKAILLLLVVGFAAAVAAAWFALRRPAQPATPAVVARTAKIARGTLERSVRVSGQTSARHYANVIAPLLRGPEGRNSLFLLKVAKGGTFVKKGDLLVKLDPQSAQDHLDDTAADVVQSQLDVRRRVAEQGVEWEGLLQTLRVTKATLDKAVLDDKASEIRTPIDQEQMKLSVEEYQASYKQQGEDLKSKQVSHASEKRILEITSIRQQRHLDRHLTDLRKYEIKSTMDGLVVLMSIMRGPGDMAQIQEGDQVFPGMPVMKVVNPASMQVDGNINQAESSQFRVGQECRISLDAFPGLTFKGKIYSMGAMAAGSWRVNYYIRNIPIRVAIEGADPRLIPDLSAAVDVILERANDALLLPLGAVSEESGKPVVYVKSAEGSFARRDVELGARSNTHAVVLAGLAEGEEVRMN